MKLRIVHLTSSHPSTDTRIYHKYCKSCSTKYSTILITSDSHLPLDCPLSLQVISTGRLHNRLLRFSLGAFKVFFLSLRFVSRDSVFHIHDPELLPYGVCLRLLGAHVIFDSHEDYPVVSCTRGYINPAFAPLVSLTVKLVLRSLLPFYSAVVSATPYIQSSLGKLGISSQVVYNYPLLEKYTQRADGVISQFSSKNSNVVYVGGVSFFRGIYYLVEAFNFLSQDYILHILGNSFDSGTIDYIKTSLPFKRSQVVLHGHIDHLNARSFISRCDVGVVTFLPAPNHLNALPNKLFEYMSEKIPVLASDFPLWSTIINESGAGLCVNPKDSMQISAAIRYICSTPGVKAKFADSGFKAVRTHYNWEAQLHSVFSMYESL